jgi:hypothetical protein
MTVKGFKKCCMSNDRDGKEGEDEAGNVENKHMTAYAVNVRQKMGTVNMVRLKQATGW